MADGGSLQRAKQQKLQPKMKGPRASPIGIKNHSSYSFAGSSYMMDTVEKTMEDPILVARDGDVQPGRASAGNKGERDYKMRFNVPGMDKDSVKVWTEENMLEFKAEKVPRKQHEDYINSSDEGSTEIEDWPAKSHDRYGHRIALPENIEFEKIKVQVTDGVLHIIIPKTSTGEQVIDIDVQ